MHKRLGLTAKQTKVYALRYAGHTQSEVADLLKMRQSRVSEVEARARLRNPRLPLLVDRRRHRVTPLSVYSNEHGSGLADVLGLN